MDEDKNWNWVDEAKKAAAQTNSTGGRVGNTVPFTPYPSYPRQTCPACGYCPHCGRSGYGTYPYWNPQVTWTTGTLATGGTY